MNRFLRALRSLVVPTLALIATSGAVAQAPQPPEIAARNYLLMDFTSGQILAAKDIDAPVEQASLTKLMAAYVVFDALRAKKVDAWISDKFTVKATLDKNPDAGISAGEMVFVERVSMILRKNNKTLEDKLNQGLAEVMKDGTYKALSEKYFKEDISCRS